MSAGLVPLPPDPDAADADVERSADRARRRLAEVAMVPHLCPEEGEMEIEAGKECNWCGWVGRAA